MMSVLQKSECCSATSAAQHSENCRATSIFACGMLQGWGLEGWGLGLADLPANFSALCLQGFSPPPPPPQIHTQNVGIPFQFHIFEPKSVSRRLSADGRPYNAVLFFCGTVFIPTATSSVGHRSLHVCLAHAVLKHRNLRKCPLSLAPSSQKAKGVRQRW